MALRPVTSIARAWPLFGAATTRRLEADALAASAPHALMQRAGEAVAALAAAPAPHARCMRVYAGPGNNGGDGLVAATRLHARGRAVEVCLIADEARLPADALDALQKARAAGVPIRDRCDGTPDLVIDALLGLGTRRAPEGAIAGAVRELNTLACPTLAVDLPTGLDTDTGRALGADAVRATHTLSLLTLKPGLFTGAGRDHAGAVWLDDLGIDTSTALPTAWLAGLDRHAAFRARAHATHKGTYADLLVLGGAPGMTGAALLAARAASAAGAGRVFVELLDSGSIGHDALRPELMFRPGWLAANRAALATVVCGCGGGEAVRAMLPMAMARAARLVLDADSLNALASDAGLLTLLRARAARGAETVLTPHPLEAARLLGCTTGEVQADRLAAAARLVAHTASIVVLKGSGSVICAPGRAPVLNPTGNASLATAGTGDVLAGWLGGSWTGDAFDASWRRDVLIRTEVYKKL